MTKKHFKALAAAIRQTQAELRNHNHRKLAEEVANVCADCNPRFNRTAFLVACGVPGWEVMYSIEEALREINSAGENKFE